MQASRPSSVAGNSKKQHYWTVDWKWERKGKREPTQGQEGSGHVRTRKRVQLCLVERDKETEHRVLVSLIPLALGAYRLS